MRLYGIVIEQNEVFDSQSRQRYSGVASDISQSYYRNASLSKIFGIENISLPQKRYFIFHISTSQYVSGSIACLVFARSYARKKHPNHSHPTQDATQAAHSIL